MAICVYGIPEIRLTTGLLLKGQATRMGGGVLTVCYSLHPRLSFHFVNVTRKNSIGSA